MSHLLKLETNNYDIFLLLSVFDLNIANLEIEFVNLNNQPTYQELIKQIVKSGRNQQGSYIL